MKNARAFSISLCLFVIPPLSAFAADACKVSALSNFGSVPLMGKGKSLPKNVAALPCRDTDQGCEFVDARDVHYYVIEGDLVNLKFVRISDKTPASALPFGLVPSDTIADVRRKISARSDAPSLAISKDGTLYAASCLVAAPGDPRFYLQFEFSRDGHLSEIRATVGPT